MLALLKKEASFITKSSTESKKVYAKYTRDLIHHNNIKALSIPLAIGFHHRSERFNLGIKLGIVYSLFINQSGKGFNNQGKIYEHQKDSAELPFKKSSIAFRLSPALHYRFKNNYSLSLSPQLQFSRGSHFNDSAVTANSTIWFLTMGIGRRF